jgi:hypothetical protein
MNNTTVSQLVPKLYPLLEEAVAAGTQHGWRRAHKYEGQPPEAHILETIIHVVLHEICERFHLIEPSYE